MPNKIQLDWMTIELMNIASLHYLLCSGFIKPILFRLFKSATAKKELLKNLKITNTSPQKMVVSFI